MSSALGDDAPLFAALRAVIERVSGPDRTPPNIGPDTQLGDGFWLDSVELLEVVVACEVEFDIVLDETSVLESGAFGTLGALADLIRSRQSSTMRNP